MATAMRASGERKPNAMRVINRILLLTDSIWPVGEAVFDRGEDRGTVFDDASWQFDEVGDPAAAGPADPDLERLDGLFVGQLEGWTRSTATPASRH